MGSECSHRCAMLSPDVRESKAVLDPEFHSIDSGFQLLDSGSSLVELGFRIPTAVFRIPKPRISDSTRKNFPDSLTWGEPLLPKIFMEGEKFNKQGD